MLEGRRISFGYKDAAPVLDEVSIAVGADEVVGLTGPSGRGKSTLGRILAGHFRPGAGDVLVDDRVREPGLNPVQYLHQSPIFAVNPRWRIGRILSEAWQPDAETRRALGVAQHWDRRFAHELSGGELQRVAIVRALAPGVRYLVADEITAALDPVTQARIWQALRERAADGLGIIAISHDAHLLKRIARRVVRL